MEIYPRGELKWERNILCKCKESSRINFFVVGTEWEAIPGGSLATRRGHGPRSKTKQVTTRRYRHTDSHVVLSGGGSAPFSARSEYTLNTTDSHASCLVRGSSIFSLLICVLFMPRLCGFGSIVPLVPIQSSCSQLGLQLHCTPLVFSRIPFRVWIGRLASLSMLPASLKKCCSSSSRRPARQDKK